LSILAAASKYIFVILHHQLWYAEAQILSTLPRVEVGGSLALETPRAVFLLLLGLCAVSAQTVTPRGKACQDQDEKSYDMGSYELWR
jgi:hypothetical protein